MTNVSRLVARAQGFATELTDRVRAVVTSGCDDFRAVASENRVSIRQSPDIGVALTVEGHHLLTLKATYELIWDHADEFLAVRESAFKVYAGDRAQGEPLFRYEFLRDAHAAIPKAHLQIHAHRDALAYVMTMAGRSTRRGKALARNAEQSEVPTMSRLHFPLGGDRFRPALEDVLQFLVTELGVDCREGWRSALAEGRQRWRSLQTKSVVRDSPALAAEELKRLGFEVVSPEEGNPTGSPKRLAEL